MAVIDGAKSSSHIGSRFYTAWTRSGRLALPLTDNRKLSWPPGRADAAVTFISRFPESTEVVYVLNDSA